MHNKNEAALRQPRTVLLAGCVCGVIASIAQPWYILSCILYALTAVLFGVGCFLARGLQAEFTTGWRVAAVTALVFIAAAALHTFGMTLLMALIGGLALYFCVTFATSAMAEALGAMPSGETRRPPRVAILFEYCAGIYMLASLGADAFPSLSFLADTISMVSLGVGFALVAKFVMTAKTGQGGEG